MSAAFHSGDACRRVILHGYCELLGPLATADKHGALQVRSAQVVVTQERMR